MVKYGMTPMQAVRSATIVSAELLRWEGWVGSITPGKVADVIVVQGDALADPERFMDVHFVMEVGEVVKGLAVVRAIPCQCFRSTRRPAR